LQGSVRTPQTQNSPCMVLSWGRGQTARFFILPCEITWHCAWPRGSGCDQLAVRLTCLRWLCRIRREPVLLPSCSSRQISSDPCSRSSVIAGCNAKIRKRNKALFKGQWQEICLNIWVDHHSMPYGPWFIHVTFSIYLLFLKYLNSKIGPRGARPWGIWFPGSQTARNPIHLGLLRPPAEFNPRRFQNPLEPDFEGSDIPRDPILGIRDPALSDAHLIYCQWF
jgi:hypothetical protein